MVSGEPISSDDERVAAVGLSELAVAHAVGAGRGQLHVLDNLVPADQLVVAPTLNPINCSGGGSAAAGRGRAPMATRQRRRAGQAGSQTGTARRRSCNKDRPAFGLETTCTKTIDAPAPGWTPSRRPIIPIVGALIRAGARHDLARPGRRALRTAARGAATRCARRWPPPATHQYNDGAGLPRAGRGDRAQAGRRERHRRRPRQPRSWSPPAPTWRSCTPCWRSPRPATRSCCRSPFYFNHEMAIEMAGCRAVPVPTDERYQLRSRRDRARDHPAHPRHRHDLAEQSRAARCCPRRRCAR